MREKLLVSITTMLLLFAMFAPGVALAWPPSYTVGGTEYGITPHGVRGNIEGQNPAVVSGWSATWLSVEHDYGQGYALAGWIKLYGYSSSRWFTEYIVSNQVPQRKVIAVTPSSSDSYLVENVSGTYLFKVNGTQYNSVAVSSVYGSPNGVSYLGGITTTSNQSPGSVANPVTFGYLQRKTSSGSWVTPVLNPTEGSPYQRTNCATGTESTFEIWDNRY